MNSVTGGTLTHNWACTEIAKKPLKIIGGIGLLGLAVIGAIFLYLRSQNSQGIQIKSTKQVVTKDDNKTELKEEIKKLADQHIKLRNQELTKRENLILLNDEVLEKNYDHQIYKDIRSGSYKEKANFPPYEVNKPEDPNQKSDKDVLNYEKDRLSFKINKLIFRINYLDDQINLKLPPELKPIYEASNQEKLESVTIASEDNRFSVDEYKNIESISFTKRRIIISFKNEENRPKTASLKKHLVTEYKVQFEEKKKVEKWQYTSHGSLWEASGYRGL